MKKKDITGLGIPVIRSKRTPQKIKGNNPKITKNLSINQPNPGTTKDNYVEYKTNRIQDKPNMSPYGPEWRGTKVRRIF